MRYRYYTSGGQEPLTQVFTESVSWAEGSDRTGSGTGSEGNHVEPLTRVASVRVKAGGSGTGSTGNHVEPLTRVASVRVKAGGSGTGSTGNRVEPPDAGKFTCFRDIVTRKGG